MTDNEHRLVARILGFPECCVEAWLIDLSRFDCAPAVERGGIHERLRTPREVEALHRAISVVLGRPWGAFHYGRFKPQAGDMEKCWVPCDQHALVHEHWYPHGEARWTIEQLRAEAEAAIASVTNVTL